jgi:hypothetical protein
MLGMYRLWDLGVSKRLLAGIAVALLAPVALWLGFRTYSPEYARDFEECVELVQASASDEEARPLMTSCNARFAGRRKAGGGYTYYDFMQDRNFDIAGPNPTPEERKEIDRAYIGYLDVQRQETISADLAKRQNEQLWADMERARQPVGPPMVLTPTNSPSATATAAAKREKPKTPHCADDSLSCSWSKITNAVKNAFASSSRSKP